MLYSDQMLTMKPCGILLRLIPAVRCSVSSGVEARSFCLGRKTRQYPALMSFQKMRCMTTYLTCGVTLALDVG